MTRSLSSGAATSRWLRSLPSFPGSNCRPSTISPVPSFRRTNSRCLPRPPPFRGQTFAEQSVVAIQNARLFENVEARTRELAKSLQELRTAQDRLVQTEKLASLGQLTAGIAHEIKNPLNFVNNFSSISVELIDELRQALAGANLDNKLRAQISEIADMLQGNLDKVVQHGKRADFDCQEHAAAFAPGLT